MFDDRLQKLSMVLRTRWFACKDWFALCIGVYSCWLVDFWEVYGNLWRLWQLMTINIQSNCCLMRELVYLGLSQIFCFPVTFRWLRFFVRLIANLSLSLLLLLLSRTLWSLGRTGLMQGQTWGATGQLPVQSRKSLQRHFQIQSKPMAQPESPSAQNTPSTPNTWCIPVPF